DLGNLLSNVKVVDTGGDTMFERNQNQVLNRIDYMARSAACNEAFRRAGLKTPFEIVQSGVVLASRRALTDSSYNSQLGISEEVRTKANTSNAPAQTIRPQFTASKKPVIVFAADAFEDNYIDEAVPHEFIHAAGFGTASGWFGGHDLKAYPHYDDIIKNCRLR
ncbi:MAG TPA: hypothetical protein VLB87_01470, partial [Pyrinomonadaceae bacterium]|nr:hypothetical protein [Pyrinomonadaceae bacterium]